MSRRRADRGPARRVVTAKGPGDLVAAVPYLVGFIPTHSIVLVSLRGPRLRLGLVARLDLPEPDATAEAVRSLCDFVRRDTPREVVVLVYDDRPWVQHQPPGSHLVEAVENELAGDPLANRAPVPVREALYVSPNRFWSYTCTSDQCCSPAGRAVSEVMVSPIAAAYVLEGRSPFADRQMLAARVAVPESASTAAVDRALSAARVAVEPWWQRKGPAWVHWQSDSVAAFEALARRYVDGGPAVRPDEAGRVLAGLLDITTRDVVATCWTGWWQALPEPTGGVDEALERWVHELRTTDADRPDLNDPLVQEAVERLLVDLAVSSDGASALAPLTLVAMQSWSRGDGALAGVAVDRALGLDPTYQLARLVDALLRSGLAPRWVEADRADDEVAAALPTQSCG